jgi:hypothetical protein
MTITNESVSEKDESVVDKTSTQEVEWLTGDTDPLEPFPVGNDITDTEKRIRLINSI